MALFIALVIGLPWLGALIVAFLPDKNPRAQNWVAAGFAVCAGVAALAMFPLATNRVDLQIPIGGAFGNFTFVADGLGALLAMIATVVGSLAVIFSIDYMRGEKQLGRYYALVLFFIGAMAGLVLTNSLLLLFFFWELVAFCSYALISFHSDDPKAVAGGIKALIITQIGGLGLLVAVLVAFTATGRYDINDFVAHAGSLPPATLSVIAFGMLIAAAAKSAQVPFHTWLPDAMEAPTPISALIHAATMVNAGVYLLARFYPAFALVPGWATTVMTIGVLSALVGAFLALWANDLKRVLAYSTISQLGYMVYAVGVGAIFASQFHLLSHAVFKALLFLGAGAVIHAVGTRDLRQMGGLGKQMPFVRNAFIVGALALAGVPILNGFWSKELILENAQSGPLAAYLAMALGVGITALYSFRVVWLVFFGEPRTTLHAHDAPSAMRVSLTLLALGTLTTWVAAGFLSETLTRTLPIHFPESSTTIEVCVEILTAPATLLILAIAILGFGAWWCNKSRWAQWADSRWANIALTNELGFEWINTHIVAAVKRAASALRQTQTGQLNWNVVGIVGGLIAVLLILGWLK